MADATTTRNRLLGVLVALMALACVLLAMLLAQPAGTPTATATTTVTASASAPAAGATSAATPAGGQTATAGDRQITFDAKGLGQLGDRARRQEGDPLAIGKADAPVVLVEWADYACPFCAVWATDQQKQLVDRYVANGTLRIEWRDLVIFGEKSQRAAQAARAAGNQGRFWEFHNALFAASPRQGHPDLTDDKLLGFAKTAGVPDLAKFKADMSSEATKAAVAKDSQEAASFGASSTPVFSINGVPIVGAEPIDTFTQVIEAAAQVQARVGA